MVRMKKKVADGTTASLQRTNHNEDLVDVTSQGLSFSPTPTETISSVVLCGPHSLSPVASPVVTQTPVQTRVHAHVHKLLSEVRDLLQRQSLPPLLQSGVHTPHGVMVITPPVKHMPKEAFLPNEHSQYDRRAHEEVAAHQRQGHLLAMDMPFEIPYLIVRILQTITNLEERSPTELLDLILGELVNLKAARTLYDPLNASTRITAALIESERIYGDIMQSNKPYAVPISDTLNRRIKGTYHDDLVTQIHGLIYRALRNMVFQFSTHETVGLPEEYVLISYTPEKLFWFLPFEAYQG